MLAEAEHHLARLVHAKASGSIHLAPGPAAIQQIVVLEPPGPLHGIDQGYEGRGIR